MPSPAGHFLKSPISNARFLVILLLAVVGLSGAAWTVLRRPGMPWLPERSPAAWIIYPSPADGAGNWAVDLSSEFRRSFVLEKPADQPAVLSICGFKRFTVAINGQALGEPRNKPANWKTPTEYEVGNLLRPGTNEISVTVWEDSGLPTVWLVLKVGNFQLVTDRNWVASMTGGTWEPAQLAREPLPVRPGSPLYGTETSLEGFRSGVWFYVAVLAVLAVCGGTRHR